MKIAIVGAGLMGHTLAVSLLHSGRFSVTIYDDGVAPAAMAAAGMIAPYSELDHADSFIATMGSQSLALWPHIIDILGDDIYFRRRGTLVCAHSADAAALSHYQARCCRHPISVNCQRLTAQTMHVLEPELMGISEAFYFPDEGQIDNQQLLRSMHAWVDRHATRKCENNISSPTQYDCIIDCRGVAARDIFTTLRSVRGEVVWLYAPDVQLTRPVRLLHPRYSIYIVPRPDHVYIIGASAIESADRGPIGVRSMMELLSAAYSVHKSFIEARIIHTATGCRPALPDHLPAIQYDKTKEGVPRIAINGLYRHGFSLAPVLAQEVLSCLSHHVSSGESPLFQADMLESSVLKT